MSNCKEFRKFCLVFLALGLILLLVSAKPAAGVSTKRYSDSGEAWDKIPSDSSGGYWGDLSTPITISTQRVGYFAFKNGYAPQNMTSLTVTFTPDSPDHLSGIGRLVNATAHKCYYVKDDGSWSAGPGGNYSTVHQANGQNVMEVHAFNDPQPTWHVLQMSNTSRTQSYTITSVTYTTFCCRRNYEGDTPIFLVDDGHFPSLDGTTVSYSQLYILPNYVEINPSITPTFSADINTGNWSYDFVYEDPFGYSWPGGGVMWESDANGISGGDVFDMTLGVEGTADTTYWVYAYDSNSSQYDVLLVDTRLAATPIIPGDVDTSFKVDFEDLAILADNWLQCNIPGDANCTWQPDY